ncbi:unnamed protein product [Effrenium voratum]|nr:unnamed protein product [Effrenium voratum]
MFTLLNESLFFPALGENCLLRKPRQVPNSDESAGSASFQRCAEFLGCKQDATMIQRMAVAHCTQVPYAMASEASSVVLPYINSAVGGNVQTFAQMQAVTSMVQFLGGLVFGQTADSFGTRWALLTAHGAAMGSAFLVATAYSQKALFLALMPLTMAHGFQASSQIAVHCSDTERRPVALGRMSATYGLGFFGGTLATAWAAQRLTPRQIAWAAVALEASVIGTVLVGYPNGDSQKGEVTLSLPGFKEILQRPHVLSLVLSKLATATAGGMLLTMIPQFAMDPFGLSAAQTSLLMAYVSGLQLVAQTFLVPQLGDLGPRSLRMVSNAAVLGPLLGLSVLGTSPKAYCALVGPLVAVAYAGSTAQGSLMSCLSPESESGAMVALSTAPLSLGFLVSPLMAGWVYQRFGFRMVPAMAAAMLSLARWIPRPVGRIFHVIGGIG